MLLDELEIRVVRIEAREEEERNHEGRRRRHQGDDLGVPPLGLSVAAKSEPHDHRCHEGQEGDDRKKVARHHSPPPAIVIQVTRTITPKTMAKA